MRSRKGLICAIFLLMVSIVNGMPDFSGLTTGLYCGKKYPLGECCPGRQDECSAPILNTLCYCDDFCDRTREEDCCPDYWNHCKGIEINVTLPPPAEIRLGRRAEVLCEQNRCLQEPDLINEINSNNRLSSLTWRARNYSKFWGRTLNEGVQLRLGTLNPSRSVYRMNYVRRIYNPESLPREFDARSRWPREISGVDDQGWCGASWAISTARVASDRFGVMSKGADSVLLSAQHLLSCNNRGQQACSGGYLDRAWLYMRKFGLVDEYCYPWEGKNDQCKLRKRTDLKTAGCRDPVNALRTELYKVGPAYRLGNETDIMQEILTSGPVQATMRVYQDFFSYESGIYKHTSTTEDYEFGYHSVRIIGWGEDTIMHYHDLPIKYWLVVNSWGPQWGEDGLFRILRGTNECEIESFVLAVWAKTV
ncbi:putative peptidase C1-like protein F26E4.3 [Eufriesea mexicana]|uniref:Putative peptidase C1-like protein F26E4.3 n=1 Tax=Eufriesea mexicana TaxID=516756 RepID=A0A310SG27_9HYME|nr:putative peptidase C1-like protein F26E4.3 [Eufriesea mexicana]